MKKIAVFALVSALLLCFTACRREQQEKNETPTQTTKETTRQETDPITVPTIPDMTMPSENIPDPTVDSNSTHPTDENSTR